MFLVESQTGHNMFISTLTKVSERRHNAPRAPQSRNSARGGRQIIYYNERYGYRDYHKLRHHGDSATLLLLRKIVFKRKGKMFTCTGMIRSPVPVGCIQGFLAVCSFRTPHMELPALLLRKFVLQYESTSLISVSAARYPRDRCQATLTVPVSHGEAIWRPRR